MLRLLERCGSSEIGADDVARVRFWTNSSRTRGEVEGFPQRINTEDTIGEREYVAASDWTSGIRDSEKPFMITVSLSRRSVCGFSFGAGAHSGGGFVVATAVSRVRERKIAVPVAGGNMERLNSRSVLNRLFVVY